MCALEALSLYQSTNGMLALLIVCLGMHVTCFIPSVHDVEHTVPATGDVCVGYVVCITTYLVHLKQFHIVHIHQLFHH